MADSSYLKVGRVKEAFGLKGDLYIRLFAKQADWLDQLSELRLQGPGGLKLFNVNRKRTHKDGVVVKPEGVDDRTAAELLEGYELEIPTEFLSSKSGEAIFLHELLGFNVLDVKLGSLGPVVRFDTNGAQDLIVIMQGGLDKQIPFVEAFIEKIDFTLKEIRMDLPPGLLNT